VVSSTGSYPQHLHVDVSGVEGADESDAPPVPPLCFRALEVAAPYLRKGWPVPDQYVSTTNFDCYWMAKFYVSSTKEFNPIEPDEQAAIDRLGLTHIVGGMRDGTLGQFNPKGLPGQMLGSKRCGTKCTICGAIRRTNNYPSHLHVDVTGVEGADAPGALVAVASPPAPEVCVLRCVAVSVVSLPQVGMMMPWYCVLGNQTLSARHITPNNNAHTILLHNDCRTVHGGAVRND
jgi:hypothetical protein